MIVCTYLLEKSKNEKKNPPKLYLHMYLRFKINKTFPKKAPFLIRFWVRSDRALDCRDNEVDGVTICSDVSQILSTHGHFVEHRYNYSNQ